MPNSFLSTIEEVLDDAKNGRMFILVDDEDRENEGDLVIPAQMATPDAINFMATYGRGLICLPLTRKRGEELGLSMMTANNRTVHETAFTVSIEASEGVTTGISAADRAHTIAFAVDPSKNKDDIVSPGHVFPLIAKDGGVLVRAGHTEAAVDISRLAGLIPAGVICEIMNDDGTMARLPDLKIFAEKHNLKIATIADLIAYRSRHDNLVKCVEETEIISEFGDEFKVRVYATAEEGLEHFVLIKGNPKEAKNPLVRMHPFNIFEDLMGEKGSRQSQFQRAMAEVGKAECGVLVCFRENSSKFLSEAVANRENKPEKAKPNLKNYGIGAQILVDIGVSDFTVLSNSEQHVVGIEGYGLNIIGHQKFDKDLKVTISKKQEQE